MSNYEYLGFQSTLPREERQAQKNIIHMTAQFQSTLPREERRDSPHCRYDICHFNPRSHERSDVKALRLLLWQVFQSTLPREERQGFHFMLFVLCNFNPRSHERSDNTAPIRLYIVRISIHAPTRGATPGRKGIGLMDMISIHAPTRGATA